MEFFYTYFDLHVFGEIYLSFYPLLTWPNEETECFHSSNTIDTMDGHFEICMLEI